MENIPADILPGFCAYPASAAAITATCTRMHSILRDILRGGGIFTCMTVEGINYTLNCVIKSDWYTYKIHLGRMRGGFINNPDGEIAVLPAFAPADCPNPFEYIAVYEPDYVFTGPRIPPFFSFTVPWFYNIGIPGHTRFRRVRRLEPPQGDGDAGVIIIVNHNNSFLSANIAMMKTLFAGLLALITILIMYIFAPDDSVATSTHPNITGAYDAAMMKKAKKKQAEISLDLLRKTEEILKKPYALDLFHNAPLYTDVSEIGRGEQYVPSKDILKLSHHNGQVKLLLTEIQFLTLVLPAHDSPAYVVYAGSAPSHKLGILLNMFPGVKFILVDPNEHQIMYPDYSGALRHTKPTAYKLRSQYDREHIADMVYFVAAKGDRFKLGRRKINLYANGSAKIVDRDPTGAGTVSPQIVDFIVKSDVRLFVIEDYMTNELADILAGLGGREAGLYFVSDIRSTAEGEFPSNAHVVWNNILHYSWLKRLQPRMYMLKYHPPYADKQPLNYEKYMLDVFAEYPVDRDTIAAELAAGKYTYVRADHMYIQAFAPQSSSEVRLVGSSLDLITYDIVDFENKLYYYNTFHRNIGNCKSHDKYVSFSDSIDNCADCAVMCHIVAGYYIKYFNTDNRQTVLGLIRLVLFTIGRDLSGGTIAHAMDKMAPLQQSVTDIAQNIYKRYILMKIDPATYTRGRVRPTVENQRYKAAVLAAIGGFLGEMEPSESLIERFKRDPKNILRTIQVSLQTYDLFGDSLFFELDLLLKLYQVFKNPEAVFARIRGLLKNPPAGGIDAVVDTTPAGDNCRGLSRETVAVCLAACPLAHPTRDDEFAYSGASLQLDAEINFIMTKYGLKQVVEINTFRIASYFDLRVTGYTPSRSPANTPYTNISIYGGGGGDDGGVYSPIMKLPADALVILSTTCVSEIMSKFMYKWLLLTNPRAHVIGLSNWNVYNGDGKLLVDTQCAHNCKLAKCRPVFVNYANISLVA